MNLSQFSKSTHCFAMRRFALVGAAWMIAIFSDSAVAQSQLVVTSDGATRVVERVRSQAQGIIVNVLVRVGDPVRKGQLLAHTELEATKLQLDLARANLAAQSTVQAAEAHSQAWTATRKETADAVKKRQQPETRLEWATAMEKMYQAQHIMQIDLKETQKIQYDYWHDQYDKRFLRSPVDGVVTEILLPIGGAVNVATHVFTVRNDDAYRVPVMVPNSLAATVPLNIELPVRSEDGKTVHRGVVENIKDDPANKEQKILSLLVRASELPEALRANLKGMKFDVLIPQFAAANVAR